MFTSSPQASSPEQLSQAWLVTVLNSIADGVIVTDGQGQVTAINRAALQLTGLTTEQAVGRPLPEVLRLSHPEQEGVLAELMQQVLQQGVTTGLPRDTRLVRPDGLDYLSATLTPLTPPAQGMVVTFREINRHRQLEDSLREQVRREHLLGEIASRIHRSLELTTVLQTAVTEIRLCLQVERVWVCRLGLEGWVEVVHEAVAPSSPSLLGQRWQLLPAEPLACLYRGESVILADMEALVQSTPWAEAWRAMGVASALLTPISQGERLWGVLVATDGLRGRTWTAAERQLVERLAVQLGIGIERAQLVQQLRSLNSTLEMQVAERTRELQQALQVAQVLYAVTEQVRCSLDEGQIFRTALDCLGQTLGADYCWAALYDETQQQATITYEYVAGTWPTALSTLGTTVELQQYPELYDHLLKGQVWHAPPVTVLPPVYAQFWTPGGQMLIAPITDDQGVMGELGVALTRPQTQVSLDLVPHVANQCAIAIRQARLYQQAQAQVVELERLNRLKDDFLSTVSHELRTPLSNMKLALKMLGLTLRRGGASAKSAKLLQYLEILEREYERETQLIQDLLQLRQLDTAQPSLPRVTVDLHQWLPAVLRPLQPQANQKNLGLTYTLDPALTQVSVHTFSLERIIAELLTNAIKYTPAGGTIHLSTRKLGDVWQLEVTNTGVEIPLAELRRIFEPFYRVPRSDRWQPGGMGLGLALVQRLVSHLGGTITADSERGHIRFRVILPLYSDEGR